MKKILALIAVFSAAFSSQAEMGLAEKIALAKKMADAAAAGREESGLVVNGGFDFAKIVEKYRVGAAESDKTALPAPAEPEERAGSEPAGGHESAPAASEGKKFAELPPVEAPAESSDKGTEPRRADMPADPSGEEAREGKPPIAVLPDEIPIKPVKPKYVVDTSDFKNGYYAPGGDSAPLPEPEKAPISSWSNGAFYLMTDDGRSISTARKILEEASAMFAEFENGNLQEIRLGDKIVVQLLSDGEKFKDAAEYVMDKNGGVTVTVLWNENLDFARFCRLVSGALLRKMIFERDGRIVRGCPMWLDEALSVSLQCRAKFGMLGELADISSRIPPRGLAEVLRISSISSETDSADCLWTLKTIERLCAKSGKFWPLIVFLSGADAQKSFAEIAKLAPERFDAVWGCYISGEVWSRAGGVRGTESSRGEIVRLAFLQAEDKSGEPLGLNPSDVWEHRENSLVRYNAERRLTEIKIALPRINPLYAEALVDLGRLYEAVLGDDEDEFEAASKAFASNLEKADRLSERARDMLGARRERR